MRCMDMILDEAVEALLNQVGRNRPGSWCGGTPPAPPGVHLLESHRVRLSRQAGGVDHNGWLYLV